MAPTTMAAQVSYMPAPMMMEQAQVQYAQPQEVVQYAQPQVVEQLGGQSVIVEQIGEWQVCEDAQGIFYHHVPSQQSHDIAPQEFLMLFPQGYNAPPMGAFAQAPQMIETFAQPQMMMQAQPQMMYAGSPQVMEMMPGQPQMMMQGQLPPVMAKVLN